MKLVSDAASRPAKNRLALWVVGIVIVCISIGVALTHFWPGREADSVQADDSAPAEFEGPIQPIVARTDLNPQKVDLGRRLFNEPRLSHDNQISCAHCHDLATGGTDRKAKSIGINGATGIINAPTVLNSGFNFSQFWDGRAPTLERQIDDPVQSPIEMGSTWPEVVAKLRASPEYVRSFRGVYNADIASELVKDSIAEFERSLSTPNSRFDRYLRGDAKALSNEELAGYKLFRSFGCSSCHQGVSVGGNMYQKLGVMAPYFTDRGNITISDRGRFNVTGNPKDMYMFKVPSFRNVALTAPYFHDGSAATLSDAVRMMGKYQLGRQLTDDEVESIVAFLKTLTGELNGKPL
jgi:cytochrome c peroxidase